MSESEQIDDGGPAFPTYGSATQIPGMSLLDYFAGQALAALIQSQSETDVCIVDHVDCSQTFANAAYLIATAMLNERKRINGS